jgi:PST family polysaccharide transporter
MDLDVRGGCQEAMTGIKHKAVSGIKWSALSQFGRQGAQLITTVILARLLAPSDFGLVSMAMVVVGFVGIFKDLGTAAAVIQRKELSEALLSSIFWLNAGFGLLAMLVLFLLAPLAGALYHEPRVVAVLQLLSLSFIVSGFGALHQALLERHLFFDTLAKLELASVSTGSVVGIGLALSGAGVWSLVFQSLTTAAVATVLLWISSSWRPQWVFQRREIAAIGRFSLNLTGFNIFNYFARNADYLLIGRYLGAQQLGFYTLAYRMLLFPLQNITTVVGRVMYPVLSTMQDDDRRFASIYLKVCAAIALIAFPLMAGLLVLAEPIVLSFFGGSWSPVILLIMIFAPVGMIQSIGATVGGIYQVKGRTDLMFRWGIGAGSLAIAAFVVGLNWGIVGVAGVYAIVAFILFYPSFAIPFRLVNMSFAQLLNALRPSFLNTSLMVLALALFISVLPPLSSNELFLLLTVPLGVAVYFTASWLTNRAELRELWSMFRSGLVAQ